MCANRFMLRIVFLSVLVMSLLSCQRDKRTLGHSIPRITLHYGYVFDDWQQSIPDAAVSTVSYCNTLAIDADDHLATNLQTLQAHDMRAIVDLSDTLANTLPGAWGELLDSLAVTWQGHESAIASLLLIERPFASQHLAARNSWSFWNDDQIDECVDLVNQTVPHLNTLIVYLPSLQASASLPATLDWIGISYFPFTQNYMPDETEFRQGWTNKETGISYQGIDFYVESILTSDQYHNQPLILMAQCFGDVQTYTVPASESQQWYYDLVETNDAFGALMWWRAFEPPHTPQYRHGIFPYVLQDGMLVENLPAVIRLHREIGERVDRPWQ